MERRRPDYDCCGVVGPSGCSLLSCSSGGLTFVSGAAKAAEVAFAMELDVLLCLHAFGWSRADSASSIIVAAGTSMDSIGVIAAPVDDAGVSAAPGKVDQLNEGFVNDLRGGLTVAFGHGDLANGSLVYVVANQGSEKAT
jgi:hypothetical protein